MSTKNVNGWRQRKANWARYWKICREYNLSPTDIRDPEGLSQYDLEIFRQCRMEMANQTV